MHPTLLEVVNPVVSSLVCSDFLDETMPSEQTSELTTGFISSRSVGCKVVLLAPRFLLVGRLVVDGPLRLFMFDGPEAVSMPESDTVDVGSTNPSSAALEESAPPSLGA